MIPVTIPFFSLRQIAEAFKNVDNSYGGHSRLHLGFSMLFSNLLYLVSRIYYYFL
jgi:hypothetical protein